MDIYEKGENYQTFSGALGKTLERLHGGLWLFEQQADANAVNYDLATSVHVMIGINRIEAALGQLFDLAKTEDEKAIAKSMALEAYAAIGKYVQEAPNVIDRASGFKDEKYGKYRTDTENKRNITKEKRLLEFKESPAVDVIETAIKALEEYAPNLSAQISKSLEALLEKRDACIAKIDEKAKLRKIQQKGLNDVIETVIDAQMTRLDGEIKASHREFKELARNTITLLTDHDFDLAKKLSEQLSRQARMESLDPIATKAQLIREVFAITAMIAKDQYIPKKGPEGEEAKGDMVIASPQLPDQLKDNPNHIKALKEADKEQSSTASLRVQALRGRGPDLEKQTVASR